MPNKNQKFQCLICDVNVHRRYIKKCQCCGERTCLLCLLKTLRCPYCRSIVFTDEYQTSFIAYCDCDSIDDEEHNSDFCQFNFLLHEVQRLQLENYIESKMHEIKPSEQAHNVPKKTSHCIQTDPVIIDDVSQTLIKKTSNVYIQTDHVAVHFHFIIFC